MNTNVARTVVGMALFLTGAGTFAAEPQKLDPANGCWTLVLEKAVADKPLTIYLAMADGKVQHAAGTTFTFNKAVHGVDGSAMKIDGAMLKGGIKVTIKPDAYVPKDKKPIACEIELNATAAGPDVQGTYKGKCGDQEVSGGLSGKLEPQGGSLKSGSFELTMMAALCDGPPFLRDALVTSNYDAGAAKNAQIRWVKGDSFHWTGKVDSVELRPQPGALTGTIKATVDSRSAVLGGKYAFTLDGRIFGAFVCGATTIQPDGKDPKTSWFFGALKDSRCEQLK
ncbi:MAG: hypothetical protein NTW87_10015 [Planctomycetota bacterium]|nr:hypothetical protein [Planctomycetota bacterium]